MRKGVGVSSLAARKRLFGGGLVSLGVGFFFLPRPADGAPFGSSDLLPAPRESGLVGIEIQLSRRQQSAVSILSGRSEVSRAEFSDFSGGCCFVEQRRTFVLPLPI